MTVGEMSLELLQYKGIKTHTIFLNAISAFSQQECRTNAINNRQSRVRVQFDRVTDFGQPQSASSGLVAGGCRRHGLSVLRAVGHGSSVCYVLVLILILILVVIVAFHVI